MNLIMTKLLNQLKPNKIILNIIIYKARKKKEKEYKLNEMIYIHKTRSVYI